MRTRCQSPLQECYGVRTYGHSAIAAALSAMLNRCEGVTVAEANRQLIVTVAAPHRLVPSLLLQHLLSYLLATRSERDARQNEAMKQIHRNLFVSGCFPVSQIFERLRKYDLTLGEDGTTLDLTPLPTKLRALILGEIYGCLKPDDGPDFIWDAQDQRTGVVGYCSTQIRSIPDAFRTAVQWCEDVDAEIQLSHRLGGSFHDPQQAAEVLLRLLTRTGLAEVSRDGHRLRVRRPFHLQGLQSVHRYGVDSFPRKSVTAELLMNRACFAREDGDSMELNLQSLNDYANKRMTSWLWIDPPWVQVELLANIYSSARTSPCSVTVCMYDHPYRLTLAYPAPKQPRDQDIAQMLSEWSEVAPRVPLRVVNRASR